MSRGLKESDLYPPLKRFLVEQGYAVKGEIKDCDVLAVRGEEAPLIVELKLSCNLSVILQAVQRLALSPIVYVGIPRQCTALKKRRKQIVKLFRMLGLGLMTIEPELKVGAVDILLDPGEYKPRVVKRGREVLLREFVQRVGDPNLGGSTKRKGLMTAYRQRAIAIAQFLKERGACKAANIAQTLEEPKARDILYRNVYGWFENVSRGVYALSPRGEKEWLLWQDEKP